MRRLWRWLRPPHCEHRAEPVWAATLDDVEGRPLAVLSICTRCGIPIVEVTP